VTTAVQKVNPSTNEPQPAFPLRSWKHTRAPEVRIDSAELFQTDEKWKLLGVTHYITRVTFRPTLLEGKPADYVSVEARVASAAKAGNAHQAGKDSEHSESRPVD